VSEIDKAYNKPSKIERPRRGLAVHDMPSDE
jgi:hypothetical protein